MPRFTVSSLTHEGTITFSSTKGRTTVTVANGVADVHEQDVRAFLRCLPEAIPADADAEDQAAGDQTSVVESPGGDKDATSGTPAGDTEENTKS